MSVPNNERQLLLALLAFQNNFIDRAALLAVFDAWTQDKTVPLAAILVERQALSADERLLLEALVDRHLAHYGNDAQKSLAHISSLHSSLREELDHVVGPELHATLGIVGREADPWATVAPMVGMSSGEGTRFKILRPHARGGLGEVFVAEDGELRREVALKQIQTQHADHADSRARFLQEAEITGCLEHPNIVPVYGLGTYADGRPFYAMRFIRGNSLQEAIKRHHQTAPTESEGSRLLNFRKLLQRFIDVCNAIDYAHSRGVLHRDLKPGNVMLGKYGETLVVDWGLAKVIGRDSDKAMRDDTERMIQPSLSGGTSETEYGSAIGTPAYMSPEQAEGKLDELGPATDVYGLGATLYHLLTGEPPIQAQDLGEALRRVVRGDLPPPEAVRPGMPNPLAAICRQAMATRPSDRYASARAMADDLERWLADETVAAHRDSWIERWQRWSRRHRGAVQGAFVGLIAIAAAAGIAALFIARSRDEAIAARLMAEASHQQADTARFSAEASEQRAVAAAAREVAARQQERKALDERTAALEQSQVQLAYNLFEQMLANRRSDDASRQLTAMSKLIAAYQAAPRDHPLHRVLVRYFADAVAISPVPRPRHEEIRLSPDGEWEVSMRISTGTINVNDSLTRRLIHNIEVGFKGIILELSPSGKAFVIGGSKGEVEVWNPITAERLFRTQHRKGKIVRVAFDDDEQAVCAAGDDGAVAAWRLADGQMIGPILQHAGPVWDCRFEGTATTLQTTSDKDVVRRRWTLSTGKQITPNAPPISGPSRKGPWTKGADVILEGNDLRVLMANESILIKDFRPACWKANRSSDQIALWKGDRVVLVSKRNTGGLAWSAMSLDAPTNIVGEVFVPESTGFGVVIKDPRSSRLLLHRDESLKNPILKAFPGQSPSGVRFDADGYRYLISSDHYWSGVVPLANTPVVLPLRHRVELMLPSGADDQLCIYSNGQAKLLSPVEPFEKAPSPFSARNGLATTGSDAGHVVAIERREEEPVMSVWDVVRRNQLASQVRLDHDPLSIAMDAAGTCVAVVDPTGAAIYSVPDLKMTAQLRTSMKPSAWQFGRTKRRLALYTDDHKLHVYDETLRTPLLAFNDLNGPPQFILFDASEERLLLSEKGATSCEIRTIGKNEVVKLELGSPLTAAAFSPDGRQLVTADARKMLRRWNSESGIAEGEAVSAEHDVGQISFDADGKSFVTGGDERTVRWWQSHPRIKLQREHSADPSFSTGLIAEPDEQGRRPIFTSGGMGRVVMFHEAGPLMRNIAQFRGPLGSCEWNRRAQAWITALQVPGFFWLTRSDSRPVEFESNRSYHPDSPIALALSPDHLLAASVSLEGTIYLHRLDAATTLGPPLRTGKGARRLTFSPNGKFLLASGGEGGIQLWRIDPEKGALSPDGMVFGPPTVTGFASWLPSGEIIFASSGTDLFICAPDDVGKAKTLIRSLPLMIKTTVGPDGRYLAGLTLGGELLIFDLRNKRLHAGPISLGNRPTSLDFHPDGVTLLVSFGGGSDERDHLLVVDAESGTARGDPYYPDAYSYEATEPRWRTPDGGFAALNHTGRPLLHRVDGVWLDAPFDALEASLDRLSATPLDSVAGSMERAVAALTPEAEAALCNYHRRRRVWHKQGLDAQRAVINPPSLGLPAAPIAPLKPTPTVPSSR